MHLLCCEISHRKSSIVFVALASHSPANICSRAMAYAGGGGGTGEGKTNGFSTGGEEDSLDSLGSRERKGGQACALLESGKRYFSTAVVLHKCSDWGLASWKGSLNCIQIFCNFFRKQNQHNHKLKIDLQVQPTCRQCFL